MRKHAFTVYGGFESDQPRGSEEPAQGACTSKPLPRLPTASLDTQHSRSPSCPSHPFALSNSSRASLMISPLSSWHFGVPDTPEDCSDLLGDWFEREEKMVFLQQRPLKELPIEDDSSNSRLTTPPKPIHLPPTPPSAKKAKSRSPTESRSSLSSSIGSIIASTRDRPPTLMNPLTIGGWGREWERGFNHRKFRESAGSLTEEDDSESTTSLAYSTASPAPSSLLEHRMSESLSLASPGFSPVPSPHPFSQSCTRPRRPPTPYEREKEPGKGLDESWLDFSEDGEDARVWEDDEATVRAGSSRWSAVLSETDQISTPSETDSRPTEASQIRDAYLAKEHTATGSSAIVQSRIQAVEGRF
ncbi:hypothetical protein I350_03487 [Cryptococcus amylolentus CBS 6273]|uniref:Uncharacterized protein n=1 Tax=Cryptococcus amylolentus CBS 6273 TaxID=1296118 RepID=A0A1E3K4R9_9TREE|nr:hypothetical protein I350_03487 [Cryptococcus amylolentus CBS 6273]